MNSRTKRVAAISVGALLLFSLPSAFAATDGSKSDLNNVRTQIKAQQQAINRYKNSLSTLSRSIESNDQKIADLATKLRQQSTNLEEKQNKINKLQKNSQSLRADSERQKKSLARQVDGMYRLGNGEYLQLLLNQQQNSDTQRMLGYYSYLNQARVGDLKRLQQTQQALESNRKQLIDASKQIRELQQQTRADRLELEQQQKQRHQQAQQLKQKLNNEGHRLGQLNQAADYLSQQLNHNQQQLKKRQAKIPMNGLKTLQGKLNWPIKGSLLHRFNNANPSGVRWKGLVISAKEGAPIKAIYSGRVLFSNWIQGFGMVIVIDHGSGYMSLYGYNQALLAKTGDTVTRGETIALAGQSGGQSQSALYFEIRYKGAAQNPTRWLR